VDDAVGADALGLAAAVERSCRGKSAPANAAMAPTAAPRPNGRRKKPETTISAEARTTARTTHPTFRMSSGSMGSLLLDRRPTYRRAGSKPRTVSGLSRR